MLEETHVDAVQAKSIETIAAAAGLLHDLGNPPFGHSGEVAIRDWFARPGNEALQGMEAPFADDFRNFEGNAQTLRLLTKLQILADFHGLNLTCGTLSAACKYVAGAGDLDGEIHERSKVGFFSSESYIVQQIWDVVGTGARRNPITFLVEAADDAVYNAVDIEDGFKKNLLDWDTIKSELRGKIGGDPLLEDALRWAEGRVSGSGIDLPRRAKEGALVEYFRVRAIAHMITSAAAAFQEHYNDIMAGDYHGELVLDSKAGQLLKACKKLNGSRVYCSEQTLQLELMGRRVIWDLMDVFWEGAQEEQPAPGSFSAKAYDLMSDNYRRAFNHARQAGTLPLLYYQLQLVTDYICGMTDSFAARLHQRLTNA
jgi:dGTPase